METVNGEIINRIKNKWMTKGEAKNLLAEMREKKKNSIRGMVVFGGIFVLLAVIFSVSFFLIKDSNHILNVTLCLAALVGLIYSMLQF